MELGGCCAKEHKHIAGPMSGDPFLVPHGPVWMGSVYAPSRGSMVEHFGKPNLLRLTCYFSWALPMVIPGPACVCAHFAHEEVRIPKKLFFFQMKYYLEEEECLRLRDKEEDLHLPPEDDDLLRPSPSGGRIRSTSGRRLPFCQTKETLPT